MDQIAKDIIKLRNEERQKQSGFWDSLWQDAATLIYPMEDQVSSKTTPGEDKSIKRYSDTAPLASQDMASGLTFSLFPPGQKSFVYRAKNWALWNTDRVSRWFMMATEVAHEELEGSNFRLHLSESLRSAGVFGLCNLYSDWDESRGRLNFKDHGIGKYQFKEDHHGQVDCVILTYTLTARQAVAKFGRDRVSEQIAKAADDLEKESKRFDFIHVVRQRTDRNVTMKNNRNMPFESLHVEEKGQQVVAESGYWELPFAVARWMKSSTEKHGRGQGTEILATVRMENRMVADFIDLANRTSRPPVEVLDSFQGTVDLRPNGVNIVRQLNTIQGINQQTTGNPQVTMEALKEQADLINRAFFRDIFAPITGLSGDRRTTVEINARRSEALQRMASPIARIQRELLDPTLTRALLLLVRNRRLPPPPPELWGADYGVEYLGPLAMELQAQQVQASERWISSGMQMAKVDPTVLDNVSLDRAYRRMGEKIGVNADDMATPEEVAAKRKARQDQLAAQQAAQIADTASDAYRRTVKKPEEGSAAEAVMGAA
jgi:hypothetical protein